MHSIGHNKLGRQIKSHMDPIWVGFPFDKIGYVEVVQNSRCIK